MEREMSGYRLVDGLVTPITSDVEVAAVESGANVRGEFEPAGEHIRRALELLADRQAPDYRNSIKESISAVESAARTVAGGKRGGLSTALSHLEQRLPLHPALKAAFVKLYAYTSDEDGIRHALLDDSDLSQEDALFMLVACSAFTNYLKTKSAAAGVETT